MTDGSCSTGSKAHSSKATTAARPGTIWQAGFSSALYDAVFLPDGQAVVVGADGTILIESPTGSFERVNRASREAITAVLATGPDSVLLFGERGIDHLTLTVADDGQ